MGYFFGVIFSGDIFSLGYFFWGYFFAAPPESFRHILLSYNGCLQRSLTIEAIVLTNGLLQVSSSFSVTKHVSISLIVLREIVFLFKRLLNVKQLSYLQRFSMYASSTTWAWVATLPPRSVILPMQVMNPEFGTIFLRFFKTFFQ